MPIDANERAYNTVPLVVESDQNNDSFIRVENDIATLRLLSWRCQESQAQSLPNQDYARLIADVEQASLVFCVSDGVGSSFMGGFAAHYLATQLVHWLQRLESNQLQRDEVDSLQMSLSAALAGWADTGQAELSQLSAGPSQSSLIQEVLEELRTSHGSETVFCAGRIDSSSEQRSLGRKSLDKRPARLFLCWMGNVRVTLSRDQQDEVDIGYVADDHTAWSTVRGLCGDVHVYLGTLSALTRMIVHTDGADNIRTAIAHLDDKQLADSARDLLQLPTSDDVTVLDVQWKK